MPSQKDKNEIWKCFGLGRYSNRTAHMSTYISNPQNILINDMKSNKIVYNIIMIWNQIINDMKLNKIVYIIRA